MSLQSKALNSLSWSTAGTFVNAFMQIGYTSVMARLLDPAAFGMVTAAQVLLRFGSYFSEMGMGKAIIQKEEVTERDMRAAFTGGVAMGLLVCAIFFVLAPVLPMLFLQDSPAELVLVVRLLALSFVLSSLSTTSYALLKRRLDFKSIAVIEMLSYIIAYGGVGIGLGLAGFGVFSLVGASLSQYFLNGVGTYLVARHPLQPLFSRSAFKPLLAFGSRFSFISFLEFFSANLDTFIIGRMKGAVVLGVYSQGFRLVQLPVQNLTLSMSKVLFPALSAIQSDVPRLRRVYLSSVQLVAFLIVPLCLGLSAAAPEAVLFLLGPKWTASIPVVRILALAIPFKLLMNFGGVVCDATGRLTTKMIIEVSYIAVLGSVLAWVAWMGYGIEAISLVILGGEIAKKTVYAFVLRQVLGYRIYRDLLLGYLPAAVAGAVAFAFVYGVRQLLPDAILQAPVAALLILVASGILSLVVAYLLPTSKPVRMELWQRFLSKTPLAKNARIAALVNG